MQEIAEALKKQRESKGYSIDDLFQRTRINPDFLRALDAGQFDILPDTYVKLFIKKYAQEVGLNVEEILAQYDKLAPAPEPPTPPPPPVHHKRNFQPIIFIAIGLCIVALLVWQIGQQGEKDIAAPLDATLSVPSTQTTQSVPTPSAQTTPRTNDTPPLASPSTEQPATPVPDLGDQASETTPNTTAPILNDTEIRPATEVTATPETETTTPELESTLESEITPQTEPPSNDVSEESTPQQTAPAPNETSMTPDQPSERLTTNEQTTEEINPTPTTMPLPVDIDPAYPILLSGIAQQTTPLVVKVDGRTLFDGVLQAGSRPRWTARNSVELILTDRNALALSLQNQPLQFDTATSQAIQLNIDRTQIRILPLSQ